MSDLDQFIAEKALRSGGEFLRSLPPEEQARLRDRAQKGLAEADFPPDGILLRFVEVGGEKIVLVLVKKDKHSGWAVCPQDALPFLLHIGGYYRLGFPAGPFFHPETPV
ncbi:MAG: hypothetical protein ACLQDL_06830 [Spirochaetia bacterium]